jgi:FlaA1/EpsC-like NDP-sugar epimerase
MIKKINTLAQMLLRRRRWMVALVQAGLVVSSLFLTCLLLNGIRRADFWSLFVVASVFVIVRIAVMPFFNLMHGWWRYTGVSDAIDVLKAVLTGSIVVVFALRFVLRITTFSAAFYIVEGLLCFVLLAGVRVISRILAESSIQEAVSKRVLLVGAGHEAQTIIRETQKSQLVIPLWDVWTTTP